MKKIFIAIVLFTTTLFAGSQDMPGYYYDFECTNPKFDVVFRSGIASYDEILDDTGYIFDYISISSKTKNIDILHWEIRDSINFDVDAIPDFFHKVDFKLDIKNKSVYGNGEILKGDQYLRFTTNPQSKFSDQIILLITDMKSKITESVPLKCVLLQ